jgi:hypothetical protein
MKDGKSKAFHFIPVRTMLSLLFHNFMTLAFGSD